MGIKFLNDEVIEIDLFSRLVTIKKNKLEYDYLIVALGTQIVPSQIMGLLITIDSIGMIPNRYPNYENESYI